MWAKWHSRHKGAIELKAVAYRDCDSVRNALDVAGIDRFGGFGHAPPGDDTVACNFSQRHKHKGALKQARMRQCQIRLVHCHIVICEDVDIRGARTIALFVSSIPAKTKLNILRAREQFTWAESGFNDDRKVCEMRLVFEPPRRCAVIGRTGDETDVLAVAKQC